MNLTGSIRKDSMMIRTLITRRPPFCCHIFYSAVSSSATTAAMHGTDKKLFTPGPLGTSANVKRAMLRDVGSRDTEFIKCVYSLRQKLLKIAGVDDKYFTAVPVQGSGTYAIESVLQTVSPRVDARVLILANGTYGDRMVKICQMATIDFHVLRFPEEQTVDVDTVEDYLKETTTAPSVVSIVHCETTTGLMNPVARLGAVVKQHAPDAAFLVDAMSSFGAVPLNLEESFVDYMVSSANKCLEGVPGFAFVIARKNRLLTHKGNSRSLSFDLVDQHEVLESTGQFRFTPPTHAILALDKALDELEAEGGVEARASRYRQNRDVLRQGMERIGFRELLPRDIQGHIITSYLYPDHPAFSFNRFYDALSDLGQLIYPGKVSSAECFRVGNIGHLYPGDMRHFVDCVQEVLGTMGLPVPLN